MNIFRKISPFTNVIFEKIPRKFQLITGGSLLLGNLLYAYGTVKESEINIESKYQIFSNISETQFMLNCKEGQYCIPFSLLYLQFNVPEIYNSFELNKTYKVKYYGFRVPILGLYPNIITS